MRARLAACPTPFDGNYLGGLSPSAGLGRSNPSGFEHRVAVKISELLAASSTSDCVIRRDGDDSLTVGYEQLLRMDTSDDRSHLLWRQGPLLYDMTSIMLEAG